MTPDDPNNVTNIVSNVIPWWLKYMMYSVLAAFGGFMGAVLRAQHEDRKFSWKRVLVEAVASGFIGLLVMLVCNEMNFSERWTGVIVGVFGWLGANASIVMLEKLVYGKLGLTKTPLPGAQDVQNPPQ